MVQVHEPGDDAPLSTAGQDPGNAFDAFFRDRYRAVVRSVMYAGASLEDAEDAASAAMIEAFLRWSLLENPLAWTRRAAVHHFINDAQRDRRRPLLEAEAARAVVADPVHVVFRADPDERAQVVALLRELPPAQREVMALTIDGFEPARIAELLQLPPANVRSNLRHARDRLRRGLKSFGDEQMSRREVEGGI